MAKIKIVFAFLLMLFSAFFIPVAFNSQHPILGWFDAIVAIACAIYLIRQFMKYKNTMLAVLIGLASFTLSCERVQISYEGVLVENYGRNFPDDYSVVTGKVNTWGFGTDLYQIPTHEVQQDLGAFAVQSKQNISFKVDPKYSFQVIRNHAKDLIYENARFKDQEDFLAAVADNVLETRIIQAYQSIATTYPTDSLMNNTGQYNEEVRERLEDEFEEFHIRLESISCVVEAPQKLREESQRRGNATIIAQRKEDELRAARADQEIQISNAQAQIEIAKLKAEANRVLSQSLTPEVLRAKEIELFYSKWNGEAIQYPENMPLISR